MPRIIEVTKVFRFSVSFKPLEIIIRPSNQSGGWVFVLVLRFVSCAHIFAFNTALLGLKLVSVLLCAHDYIRLLHSRHQSANRVDLAAIETPVILALAQYKCSGACNNLGLLAIVIMNKCITIKPGVTDFTVTAS